MANYLITGAEVLEAYDYLLENGFTEADSRVHDEDNVDNEPLRLLVNKSDRTFCQIDKKGVLNASGPLKTIQQTNLNEIKQWQN